MTACTTPIWPYCCVHPPHQIAEVGRPDLSIIGRLATPRSSPLHRHYPKAPKRSCHSYFGAIRVSRADLLVESPQTEIGAVRNTYQSPVRGLHTVSPRVIISASHLATTVILRRTIVRRASLAAGHVRSIIRIRHRALLNRPSVYHPPQSHTSCCKYSPNHRRQISLRLEYGGAPP